MKTYLILNGNGNSGKKFIKLLKSKKRKIVSELKNLLQMESRWKTLVKGLKFNSQKILELSPQEVFIAEL